MADYSILLVCSDCGAERYLSRPSNKTLCTRCRKRYDARVRDTRNKIVYKEEMSKCGCAACGFNHPDALEVHHLAKGTKKIFSSGRSQSVYYNIKDIIAGTAIYLCANCHLLFHSHFGGRHADFPDQTKESTVDIINKSRSRYIG